ncbi:hypothetical protein [Pseudomonas sp. QTF5]|uniref:hypothetical protein n=1 Tax=Pseudomonas sp. QTF5 TaxID=1435425 RepID=UPI001C44E4FB|nr:hypothetical protein [Pseudomonas sp. QTF5]
MSYSCVVIYNSTPYKVSAEVEYMSLFCSNDELTIDPFSSWEASSRGVCLLTEISATVFTPDGNVVATPYISSGTSDYRFAIIQTGAHSFEVTSVENLAKDIVPEGYREPTVSQK